MEQVNHPAAYFKRTSGTAVSLSRPQKRSVESTTVSLDGNLIAVSEIGLRFAHSPLFFSLSPFQWCRFSRVSVTMDSPLCHLFHVSGSQGQPAGLIFFFTSGGQYSKMVVHKEKNSRTTHRQRTIGVEAARLFGSRPLFQDVRAPGAMSMCTSSVEVTS